jgi:hypothetical protein
MYRNRPMPSQARVAPQAQQQMALAQALRSGGSPPFNPQGVPPQRPVFTPGVGLPPQAQATLPPQAMGGMRPPMPQQRPPMPQQSMGMPPQATPPQMPTGMPSQARNQFGRR